MINGGYNYENQNRTNSRPRFNDNTSYYETDKRIPYHYYDQGNQNGNRVLEINPRSKAINKNRNFEVAGQY